MSIVTFSSTRAKAPSRSDARGASAWEQARHVRERTWALRLDDGLAEITLATASDFRTRRNHLVADDRSMSAEAVSPSDFRTA